MFLLSESGDVRTQKSYEIEFNWYYKLHNK